MRRSECEGLPASLPPSHTTPLPCPVPCAGQPRARLRLQTLDLPDERRWRGPWGAGGGRGEHPALLSTVG